MYVSFHSLSQNVSNSVSQLVVTDFLFKLPFAVLDITNVIIPTRIVIEILTISHIPPTIYLSHLREAPWNDKCCSNGFLPPGWGG